MFVHGKRVKTLRIIGILSVLAGQVSLMSGIIFCMIKDEKDNITNTQVQASCGLWLTVSGALMVFGADKFPLIVLQMLLGFLGFVGEVYWIITRLIHGGDDYFAIKIKSKNKAGASTTVEVFTI